MNADTEVDLDDLHDAIAADIQAKFPSLQTVEFYREEEDRKVVAMPLPACLLEMDDFEEVISEDPGTEQLAVDVRFVARFILSFRTPNAKRSIRKLVAAFAAFLRNRRWVNPHDSSKKLPTGPAGGITATPDDFLPDLDQFEVWRVEWVQRVHLGETVWTDEGTPPTQVLIGWAPDIGADHEDDYIDGIPNV